MENLPKPAGSKLLIAGAIFVLLGQIAFGLLALVMLYGLWQLFR